jgi:hypothetical protein
MKLSALLFLLGAWAFVLGLTGWSWWKLLTTDPSKQQVPPPGTSL